MGKLNEIRIMNLHTCINRWPSQIGAQKTMPASRPFQVEAQNTAVEEEMKFILNHIYEEG